MSTLGRAIAAAGLAIVLGSCASAPTGHYRFALAAQGALPAAWSLNSLPRHGRIDLLANASEEATPSRGAHVRLGFSDSEEAPFSLAALDVNDPACRGAYSFAIESSKRRSTSDTEYFDRQLPWGAPLKVRVEWWPGGRLEIEIADVGRRTLTLRGRASTFELRLLAGGLVVSDLDFEDLGSS